MRTSLLFAAVVTAFLTGAEALRAQNGQPAGTNVAVIDIGYIFKNATRFKQTMDELKKSDEEFQNRMEAERDTMTKKLEQLKTLPKTSREYEQLEEHIASEQTRLRLEVGRHQKDRVEKEAKVYFNAYSEIQEHVQRIAGKYRIGLVLRFNGEEMDPAKPDSVLSTINRFVVYHHHNLDITNIVLDEMNRGTPTANRPTSPIGPNIPRR